MTDDDAKSTILARRARFVAAALAGVGIAAACRSGGQQEQPPEACLSVPQEYEPDAAVGPEEEAEEGEADAGPPPQPCLSPEPPPQVCLSQPAPEKPFAKPPPDES